MIMGAKMSEEGFAAESSREESGTAQPDSYDTLVSVITATYNRAAYLPEAIESVLNQTHRNLEYHIVDDGSTDATRTIVEPYLRDARVRYYVQENRGQSVARNAGLTHARGRFIAFLDSDDVWKCDKLESQLHIFEAHPEVDVVHSDEAYIDEKGHSLDQTNMTRYSGYVTEKLLENNFISFDTALFRRECYEVLGGLDESLRRSDDYELWLRYSTRFRFHYQPEKTIKYRMMPGQLSDDKDARFQAIRLILDRFFEQNPHAVSTLTRRRILCRYYVTRGRHRAGKRKFRAAFSDYATAIGYAPTAVGPWRALLRMVLLWR